MSDMQKAFEDWISNSGKNTETKLEKTENGRFYLDKETDNAWFCFKSGYCYCSTKDD